MNSQHSLTSLTTTAEPTAAGLTRALRGIEGEEPGRRWYQEVLILASHPKQIPFPPRGLRFTSTTHPVIWVHCFFVYSSYHTTHTSKAERAG